MAITLSLRLTGEAEAFVRKMRSRRIDEREIVARALWLYELAERTGKLAVLDYANEPLYLIARTPDSEADKEQAPNLIHVPGIASEQP